MNLKLTETDKEIILAYAEGDMKPSRAAAKTYFTVDNIHYHLSRIKEKTGIDPRKFYDLVKLIYEIKKGGEQ